jgi:hypothetical protein
MLDGWLRAFFLGPTLAPQVKIGSAAHVPPFRPGGRPSFLYFALPPTLTYVAGTCEV